MFQILEKQGKKRLGKISTMHGDIFTPAFGPDATRGLVKSVAPHDLLDLSGVGVRHALPLQGIDNLERRNQNELQFMLTNTYHMRTYPGDEFVREMGGIHKFMKWPLPVLTDSGGFQVFSLINAKPELKGKITENGAVFKNPLNGAVLELTPEIAIDIQFNLGSDIMMVLDDPKHPNNHDEMEASVHRTIEWAKRCKVRYEENLVKYGYRVQEPNLKNQGPTDVKFQVPSSNFQEQAEASDGVPLFQEGGPEGGVFTLNDIPDPIGKLAHSQIDNLAKRPLLFGIVQGGNDLALRKYCIDELEKIGFDGYGYGGYPTDEEGNFPYKTLEYLADILPEDKPRYAMGVGTPENMERLIEFGWDMFDCVIPSRNARHGLCYTTEGDIRILSSKYKKDTSPLDPNLKSIASEYEKYYLHHLFKIGDPAGGTLLTLHNLKFYNYIMTKPFR
jgi:queuine tRNA-ribosyltransferase